MKNFLFTMFIGLVAVSAFLGIIWVIFKLNELTYGWTTVIFGGGTIIWLLGKAIRMACEDEN